MNIVLVNFAQNIRTLGALNLSTYLRAHGYSNTLIYCPLPHGTKELPVRQLDSLAAAVADMKPDVIGVSLTTVYFHVAAQLTARLKREHPSAVTVWGGIHPTVAPDETLEHCDAACVGEGEESFLEFVRRIEGGADYHRSAGFHVKRDGETFRNGVLNLRENLDERPFPVLDWQNTYALLDGEVLKLTRELFVRHGEMSRRMYDVMASRGCPFSCSYCCNSTLKELYSGKGRFLRFRTVEHVMEELEYVRREFPEVRLFNFQDDSFGSAPEAYLTRFSELYRRKIGLPFHIRIIPGMTGEAKIRILKQAGLVSAVMGLQSSDRINREVFQRRTTREQFIAMTHLLHRYKIAGRYDAIVSNPYGTAEDEIEIIRTFLEVPKPYRLNIYALAFFPYTRLTEKAIADGLYDPVAAGYEHGYGNASTHRFPELVGILGMMPYSPRGLMRFFLRIWKYRAGRALIRAYWYGVFQLEWKLLAFIARNAKRMVFATKAVFKLSELRERLRLRKQHSVLREAV